MWDNSAGSQRWWAFLPQLCRAVSGGVEGVEVLAQHVLRIGEMAYADDHDLAQPPLERGLPAHGVGMVEPALGERRAVEQHAIDVEQLAAPPGAVLLDHLGEFRVVLLLDQRNASHHVTPS